MFFQNADGNINLDVILKDPDVNIEDIFWYYTLSLEVSRSFHSKEGLVTFDKKWKTYSCYAELHRNGINCENTYNNLDIVFVLKPRISHPVGSNGRNNIIVPTPMKFLSPKVFEKRQKSINFNLALMSSMMAKVEF